MIGDISAIPMSNQDRRLVWKTFKFMDDAMKACQNPRLSLKNSPPFILDILPDTYTQLMSIFTANSQVLRDNAYLKIFLENMQNKCKQVLKLFKDNDIFDELSAARRSLTKFSLTFSHMLFELKSEFPNGIFVGDKFRITKREAEEFWNRNFPKRTVVPWNEFLAAMLTLDKTRPISQQESISLKATIDLTSDDYVSNFEFDVFTRLFYPWKTLIRNWQLLTTSHPGYVAFLTYDEVKRKLEKLSNKPGSYVFRLSCTRPGQWAIGYVAPDGKIYQTIPQNKSLIQALHEGSKEGFYLYPNGRNKDIDLSTVIEMPQADRVKVTPEQYELYCEMGTTFEMCKICDDNEKNVKIEPCGHLLCAPCLSSWQESESGNTCPFCRYEIKGTNRVIIDRFSPTAPSIETELVDLNDLKAQMKKHIKQRTISKESHPQPSPRITTNGTTNGNETAEVPLGNLIPSLTPPVMAPPLPPRNSIVGYGEHKRSPRDLNYVNVTENTVPAALLDSRAISIPSTHAPALPSPLIPTPVQAEPVNPGQNQNRMSSSQAMEYVNTADIGEQK
ncbi:hypothetical protein WR25_01510 [Diploscapter pachys]|uniref:E3 ubiquitin-protein ligase CBL n=1 Tax=Diploscapter pachys TaxID=2018661 RepID=A0A2A2J1V9_9BILA|nr:hypothetical protein WR25_01510 [Diploscapter pachys]